LTGKIVRKSDSRIATGMRRGHSLLAAWAHSAPTMIVLRIRLPAGLVAATMRRMPPRTSKVPTSARNHEPTVIN